MDRDLNDVLIALDNFAADYGFDFAVNVTVAAHSAWSCELRVTMDPNARGADVSFVTWATGGADQEEVVESAFDAMLRLLDLTPDYEPRSCELHHCSEACRSESVEDDDDSWREPLSDEDFEAGVAALDEFERAAARGEVAR